MNICFKERILSYNWIPSKGFGIHTGRTWPHLGYSRLNVVFSLRYWVRIGGAGPISGIRGFRLAVDRLSEVNVLVISALLILKKHIGKAHQRVPELTERRLCRYRLESGIRRPYQRRIAVARPGFRRIWSWSQLSWARNMPEFHGGWRFYGGYRADDRCCLNIQW